MIQLPLPPNYNYNNQQPYYTTTTTDGQQIGIGNDPNVVDSSIPHETGSPKDNWSEDN